MSLQILKYIFIPSVKFFPKLLEFVEIVITLINNFDKVFKLLF